MARPGPRAGATPSTSSSTCPTVVPSIAGPKRPQDRIALADAKAAFRKALQRLRRRRRRTAHRRRRGRRGVVPGQRPAGLPTPTTAHAGGAARRAAAGSNGRPSKPVAVTMADGTASSSSTTAPW